MFSTRPIATNDVRIKLNHLMEYRLSADSFLLSRYLLNSRTFKTINTIAAVKNRTWKN
jgi:hypothetical protein